METKEPKFSVSPAGEKFALPERAAYAAEFDRIARLVEENRAAGREIVAVLGVDHYQAGVWLGSKWHFPRDLLLVMEHHYNPAYRGDHWPLVLLEGLAAQHSRER